MIGMAMIVSISDISHDNHFYQQDIENMPEYTEEAFVHLDTAAVGDEGGIWRKSGEQEYSMIDSIL